MTHQDDLHPVTPDEQPAMELLDGTQESAPVKRPMFVRLVRGGLYGVLLLSASALLAISAVPELSNYVTFIPDTNANHTCPFKAKAGGGSCTAHQVASLEDYKGTPCSTISADDVKVSLGGCCSKGTGVQAVALACERECPLSNLKVTEETLPTTLLTDEQLALLPAGEDLD